jgi:hypothetical protein
MICVIGSIKAFSLQRFVARDAKSQSVGTVSGCGAPARGSFAKSFTYDRNPNALLIFE